MEMKAREAKTPDEIKKSSVKIGRRRKKWKRREMYFANERTRIEIVQNR